MSEIDDSDSKESLPPEAEALSRARSSPADAESKSIGPDASLPSHLFVSLLLGSSGGEGDILARWSNPKSTWSLSAYIRHLQRVCAQLDATQPLASDYYQSMLTVNYNWKRLIGWEMKIQDANGQVLQSWIVRGAKKDWPIDLISSRLRLSLNGYSKASLDELTAFASLMDLIDNEND